MLENEMIHAEIIESKRNSVMEEYSCEIDSLTRNITIRPEDISEGILTEEFFNRTDVSEEVLDILLVATVTLKDKLEFINV